MALLDSLHRLFEHGGLVLIAILVISTVMWTFIIERYLYIEFIHPKRVRTIQARWQARADHTSWFAQKLREGLVGDVAISLQRHLGLIQVLVSVLPLLGLLGTVTGMIATFEIMMVFGTGNARGMASGISEALITTTAGLVTSLSGLYFSSQLNYRAQIETQKTSEILSIETSQ